MDEHYLVEAEEGALTVPSELEDAERKEKYLLFTSNQLLFGVQVKYTLEIINGYSFTTLPLAPLLYPGNHQSAGTDHSPLLMSAPCWAVKKRKMTALSL